MKRVLSCLLVLLLAFGLIPFASAELYRPAGKSLTVVQPGGGLYLIVTEVTPGSVSLKYGYHQLKHFESPPDRYSIRIDFGEAVDGSPNYQVTYERVTLDPAPKKLNEEVTFDPRYDHSGGRYFVSLTVYFEDGTRTYFELDFETP